jgi:hypothetical protein
MVQVKTLPGLSSLLRLDDRKAPYLLDNIDQFLHGIGMSAVLTDDDSSGPVPHDMGTCGLDDVQILGIVR